MRTSEARAIIISPPVFDFVDKVRGFLETAVNTRETHIRDLIDSSESIHDELADHLCGHLPLVTVADVIEDAFYQILEGFGAHRALLARLFDSREKLVLAELFTASITLYYNQSGALDFFVSGESVATCKAFAAPTDSSAFAGRTRVDDFIVLAAALGASHNVALLIVAELL
jgi:hypothetical protein